VGTVSHGLGLAIRMPGAICMLGLGIVISPAGVVVANLTDAAVVPAVGMVMAVAAGPTANRAAPRLTIDRPGTSLRRAASRALLFGLVDLVDESGAMIALSFLPGFGLRGFEGWLDRHSMAAAVPHC
jgi:hypothetical protein